MALTISRGPKAAPLRVLLYGPPGVGKTTLAAKAPGAVFLGEAGSNEMDVARIEGVDVLEDVFRVLGELREGARSQGFRTLVIDTLDWLEEKIQRQVCKENGNVRSLGDIPYGNAPKHCLAKWRQVIVSLEALAAAGVGVLLVAHAASKTFKNPCGDDYERYSLQIDDKAASLLYGWVDAQWFAARDVDTAKGSKFARAKAVAVKRWLYTADRPAFQAKTRWPLEPRILLTPDLEFDRLTRRPSMASNSPKVSPGAATVPQRATPPEPTPSAPTPVSSPPAGAPSLSRVPAPTQTVDSRAPDTPADAVVRGELVKLIESAPKDLAEKARRYMNVAGARLPEMLAWLQEEIRKAEAIVGDSIGGLLAETAATTGLAEKTTEPPPPATKPKRAPRAPKNGTESPKSTAAPAVAASAAAVPNGVPLEGAQSGGARVVLSEEEEERLATADVAPWRDGE